jgi:hypothetical protein
MEKEEGRGVFAQQKLGLEALTAAKMVCVVCSDPEVEPEKADQILQAIISAQRELGRRVEVDPARFQKYLCDKTRQIKSMYRCASVQFWISTEDGKLIFKAAKA